MGVQKYNEDTHEQFEFSVDDVIEKYSSFLNPEQYREPQETLVTEESDQDAETDNESSSEANVSQWVQEVLPK